MGDVTALSTEDLRKVRWPDVLRCMQKSNRPRHEAACRGRQENLFQYRIAPEFSVNGRAYLVGLAMTDTPAAWALNA